MVKKTTQKSDARVSFADSGLPLELSSVLSLYGHKLLKAEKNRRGYPESELVFIGMADVASYRWCAMKSVLESEKMESAFFTSYLTDRVKYSYELGYDMTLNLSGKKSLEKNLDLGSSITLKEVNALLKQKASRAASFLGSRVAIFRSASGGMRGVLGPGLSASEVKECKKLAAAEKIRLVNMKDLSHTERGKVHQFLFAEKYPSIRWNFSWKDYVIVGVPDGMTDELVYEFKTTQNRFTFSFQKWVADTQADLYGYFFERPFKRLV